MNGHDPLHSPDHDAELRDRTRRALGRLRDIAPGATANLTRRVDAGERRRSPLLAVAAALVVLGGVAGLVHLSGRAQAPGVAESPTETTAAPVAAITTPDDPSATVTFMPVADPTAAVAPTLPASTAGPTAPTTTVPPGAAVPPVTVSPVTGPPLTVPPAAAAPDAAAGATAPASTEPWERAASEPPSVGLATTSTVPMFSQYVAESTLLGVIDPDSLITAIAVATSAELNAAFVDRGVCDLYLELEDDAVLGHRVPADALLAVVAALGMPTTGYVEVSTDSGMVAYFAGLGPDGMFDASAAEAAVLVEQRTNGTWTVTEAVVPDTAVCGI